MNPLSFIPTSTAAATRVDPAPRRAGDDSHRASSDNQAVREPDTVDFSPQARNISSSDAPIRQDLVQRVRDQIAAGTYETPTKYLTALSKAIGQIDPNS